MIPETKREREEREIREAGDFYQGLVYVIGALGIAAILYLNFGQF